MLSIGSLCLRWLVSGPGLILLVLMSCAFGLSWLRPPGDIAALGLIPSFAVLLGLRIRSHILAGFSPERPPGTSRTRALSAAGAFGGLWLLWVLAVGFGSWTLGRLPELTLARWATLISLPVVGCFGTARSRLSGFLSLSLFLVPIARIRSTRDPLHADLILLAVTLGIGVGLVCVPNAWDGLLGTYDRPMGRLVWRILLPALLCLALAWLLIAHPV